MERAVRMIFANVMFDTWLDSGGGAASLRSRILAMARRLAIHGVPDEQNMNISEHAGLISVHCHKFEADTETLRRERGCAIFSIRPDGLPGPGIPFANGQGEGMRSVSLDPWRTRGSKLPRDSRLAQDSGEDAGPLFGPGPIADSQPKAISPSAAAGKDEILYTAPVLPELRRPQAPFGSKAPETGVTTSQPSPENQTLWLSPLSPRRQMLTPLRAKLEVAGSVYEGFSTADGRIRFTLPGHAKQGRLMLILSDEPGHSVCGPVCFRPLPDPDSLPGVRARLHLLGFDTGSLGDRFDADLALALQKFQRHLKLPEQDGALDEATRTRLLALVGQQASLMLETEATA